MSKIAILSDIHGNLPALEAVEADALKRGALAFINLGDILSGPLWPRDTADYLMQRDWFTIAGNQERQLLTIAADRLSASDSFAKNELSDRHLQWLSSLPVTMAYNSDIFLCHGTPQSDLIYFLEDVEPEGAFRARIETVEQRLGSVSHSLTFCGHTHIQRKVTLADGRTVANPGSVGLPAYDDIVPYPHVMEAGTPHARYILLDGQNIMLLQVAYDHETAAAKAEREGRADWAIGLRTGKMH